MSFTNRFIQSLKAKKTSYYKADTSAKRGVGRLVVKVYPSERKRFYFRYYRDSKREFIPIGDYPSMSLLEANNKASFYTQQLTQGIDPIDFIEETNAKKLKEEEEAKQLAKVEAMKGSVRQLFEGYTQDMKKQGKRTADAVMEALERDVIPILGENTKASDVTANDIKLVISKLIQRGSEVQSNRIRSYIMAGFNYAIRHDNDPAYMNREALFGITYNPVLAIPRQNVEKVGERDLSTEEIAILWQDLSKDGFMRETELCIKLCFTTGGQRPNEVLLADWSEIRLKDGIWDIPASKTKNKRPHVVPLTPLSIQLLKELKKLTGHSPYLFPSRYEGRGRIQPNSISKAVRRYCRKEEINGVQNIFYNNAFVPRDIRRTVKTRMGEIGLNKEIRDRIANHALTDVASKHYDRYDYLKEKREALDFWCEWLEKNTNNTATLSAK